MRAAAKCRQRLLTHLGQTSTLIDWGMGEESKKQSQPRPPSTRLQRRMASRRDVLKISALAGAALPLVLTLAPSEARAQDSGEGS